MASGPRRVPGARLLPRPAIAPRAATPAASLTVAGISSQHGDDTELLLAHDRCGANRPGGGLAKELAGDVPLGGRRAPGVTRSISGTGYATPKWRRLSDLGVA